MEPKNLNKPRHFQFQHPIFVGNSKKRIYPNWMDTVYYCWFEYLKRNTAYLDLLDSGSENEITRDFGDPRNRTFRDWWTEDNRGGYLFGELEEDNVIKLNAGDVVTEESGFLVLRFPLSLPREFLKKKLDRFLDDCHDGERGRRHTSNSRAKYKFNGQPNVKTLKQYLEVYDRYIENPEISLLESCKGLSWVEYPNESDKGDYTSDYSDKKSRLHANLKRQLKQAITAIEATSYGCFPKV